MKVIALELGYDNVALRHPGDEFDMPDNVFEDGGLHFFEPKDPAAKEKVAAARKAARKPEVAAIDPAKQSAAHEAAIKALIDEHAASIKALQDENDALKKAQPKK
jgi:hypothetical protein